MTGGRRLIGLLLCLLVLASPSAAMDYSLGVDPSMLLYKQNQANLNEEDVDGVIQAFTALYLRRTFLDDTFGKMGSVFGDDGGNYAAENGMINEMWLQKVAEDWAEHDIVGLNDMLRERILDQYSPEPITNTQ